MKLGLGTKPSENQFEGSIEEVDTGKELKFRSKEELLKFLGERFQAVFTADLENGKTQMADLENEDNS